MRPSKQSTKFSRASKGDGQASFFAISTRINWNSSRFNILRESSNCSFWRSSTKPAHRASGCQQQTSGLIKVLNHSAIHSTITTREESTPFLGDPLGTRYRHLGTMTQNDKAKECEMMYTLILASVNQKKFLAGINFG